MLATSVDSYTRRMTGLESKESTYGDLHLGSQDVISEISSANFQAASDDGDDSDDHGIRELQAASEDMLVRTALGIVASKIAASNVIDADVEDRIPKFDKEEVRLGIVIGRGGFGVVYDVEKIKIESVSERNVGGGSITSNSFFSRLKNKAGDNQSEPIPELQSNGGSTFTAVDSSSEYAKANLSRDWIAGRSKRSRKKGSKFVLKRVNPGLFRSDRINFLKGIVDLAIEAKYLASLDHPNVISLCGISRKGSHDFLILEKLSETLSSRLKAWAQLDRQCKGITGAFVGSKKKREDLLITRINAAHDIAAAVSYLHERNIIFRDLKPDNCGFDVRDTLKLFDFGLARELSEVDRDENGLYKMTSMTGAIRYMAPEVGLGKPYNLKADVYSWSMIVWYLLALEPPFGLYTNEMMKDRIMSRGSRPAVYDKWPTELAALMKRCWDANVSERPEFPEIIQIVKDIIMDTKKDPVAPLGSTLNISR